VLDPEAIRAYIRDARTGLGTRYVLLVGGDSFDYRDYAGLGSLSLLPSLYAPTSLDVRFTPSDALFADGTGDGVPDVAIGRFPVRTAAELQSMITKTLAYEAGHDSTLLSVTDLYDGGSGVSFASEADALQGLAGSWTVVRADADILGAPLARQDTLDTLNSGVALAHYIGHSSPNLWSSASLFTADDAATLTNAGHPSVVVQWGCWNTYYVWPYNDTLGQRLLLSGDRGAVAVVGSADLTALESDEAVGPAFFNRLLTPGTRIGDALLQAKQQVAAAHPEMADVILGWTLLGDPALVVAPDTP
jgi:hypothetical protein